MMQKRSSAAAYTESSGTDRSRQPKNCRTPTFISPPVLPPATANGRAAGLAKLRTVGRRGQCPQVLACSMIPATHCRYTGGDGRKLMELRGAVALVTGGNGGLGQRICHALAREGVHIAVMYAQSRDQAEGVARELASSYQVNAAAFACDITDGAAVERLVGDVTKRFGRLDILVNDAAFNKSVPYPDLDNLTLELWEKIMAVNLTGPLRLIKAVAPVMKSQG